MLSRPRQFHVEILIDLHIMARVTSSCGFREKATLLAPGEVTGKVAVFTPSGEATDLLSIGSVIHWWPCFVNVETG